MKLTRIRQWWFGIIFTFKAFKIRIGATYDRKIIFEGDIQGTIQGDMIILDNDEQFQIEI